MPLIIRHAFVCPIPDDPGQFAAGRVTPSRWNADLVANMDSGRVLGRTSSGTGAVEEIAVSSPLTLSSGTLGIQTFSSTQAGVVPASGGGTTNFLRADGTWAAPPSGGGGAPTDADYVVLSANATLSNERVLVAGSGLTLNDGGAGGNVTLSIGSGAVTDSMLRNSAGLSVIGRASNTSGSPADIIASTDGHVLRRSGTTLGFGQVSTAGIADAAITDAKLRNSAALSVIGRAANTAGAPADITASTDGHVLRRSGTTLGFGQVATAGVEDNAITDSKLRDSAGLSVIGRALNSTGDPADIVAANDGEVLRRSGTTLAFGTLTSGAFAANTMPVSTISMTSGRLLGRTTTGAGSAEEITVSGPLTLSSGALSVQTFSASQPGVVPASGGGTTNFLRADGTWAAPPSGGGGGSPGGSDRQVQFNNAGAFGGALNVEIESGGHLRLPAVTSDPSAPSSAGLVPYVRSIAARPHIWVRSSASDPVQALQRALYHMRHPQIVGPTSGTSAPTALGVTLTTSGTLSFQFTASSSNRWTSTPRKRYVSATTAGSTAGVRAGYVSFYRGSAAGYGGIFFAARFGQSANFDNCQFFAGLCASTAVLGGEPSALTNMIGMGYDSTQPAASTWRLMHNDASGTATIIDLGSAASRGVDQGFDLFIYNPPNSGNFHVQIIRLADNTEIYNNVISSDVPAADTGLTWKIEARNGATTNAVSVEHNFIYVEQLS